MKPNIITSACVIVAAVCAVICSLNTHAAHMNYQGVLKHDGAAWQGNGYFKFTLGNSSDTTNYWANDNSPFGEPGTHVTILVTNGFFHVTLGESMTSIPTAMFADNSDVYLRVWFAESQTGTFSTLGTAQKILPVPFAYNSEMLEGLTFHTLTNSINVDDADADPSNEFVTAVALSNAVLEVTDASGTISTDLSSLINDADADPSNEFVTAVALSNAVLEVTDGGGTISTDLSSLINDADADPSNEFVTAVALSNAVLEITDAGGTISTDLSSLINDSDWDVVSNDMYNANSGNVNIIVSNANDTLEIVGNTLIRNADGTSVITLSPAATGTNLTITGSDNDGTTSIPLYISDEDGYDIAKIRASLAPGALYGTNAAHAELNGTVEARTFIGGDGHRIGEGADYSFIGGGLTNIIKNSYSDFSSIAGGKNNVIGMHNSSPYAFIGGGRTNVVDNDYSVICGGRENYISRLYSFIGNGRNNVIKDDRSVICGGRDNLINEYGEYGFIGGGYRHVIRSYNPSDMYNTLVGGFINSISNSYEAFIGGGAWNNISYGPFSTIGGGQRNISFEKGTTISGGRANRIVGEYCTVGGGWSNKVDGYSYYSTIPGGLENRIYAGNYCFAAGRYARAWHNGCFVWADSNKSTVDTTTHNQFIARASGGFVFYTAANGTVTGARLPGGSGSWSSLSDRNAKENITPLDGREVLDKLCALPISTWNYKAQDENIRHAGPMAQDFYAAFGLGEDERHLSTVDVDGIAFAAIQELKTQKDKEIAALRQEKNAEIDELKEMIKGLKERIEQIEKTGER